MKFNIKRIDYYGKEDSHGKWWRWNEICDRCGAECRDSSMMTMTPPDEHEPDYCIKCLRELIKTKK